MSEYKEEALKQLDSMLEGFSNKMVIGSFTKLMIERISSIREQVAAIEEPEFNKRTGLAEATYAQPSGLRSAKDAATSEDLKPGDVVRIKSGGPKITIATISDGRVHCFWFDGNYLHDGFFAKESLVKEDD